MPLGIFQRPLSSPGALKDPGINPSHSAFYLSILFIEVPVKNCVAIFGVFLMIAHVR